MDEDRRTLLRRLRHTIADRSLEPTDPYRVPLHEHLDTDDSVALMREAILQSEDATLHLFSGYTGTGKTTELLRLRRDLVREHYVVLMAEASDYLDTEQPVAIGTMLMVLAGAFSDAMEVVTGLPQPKQSYWDRLKDLIRRTEVRLEKIDAQFEYTSPGKTVAGGIKAGINIKGELKTGSNFLRELQKFLESNLVTVQRDAEAFFAECQDAIRARHGKDTQVVFVFDGLEKFRGAYTNWPEVIRSVHSLFSHHIERLRLPGLHCVYAVPPWLKLLHDAPPGLRVLSTVHLWDRGPSRAPSEPALGLFREIVRRRLQDDGIMRLFGPDGLAPGGPVDQLIGACGGQVRGLLRLIGEVLSRGTTLPVGPAVITRVIAQAKRDFLPIAIDDARLLDRVSETQNLEPQQLDPTMIERLSNFINNHMIICFDNGDTWYDTHPLIRDEVARLAARPAGD